MLIQNKYVTIWNSKVHYVVEGEGKKILLFLHGWPGPFSGFGKVVERLFSSDPEFKTVAEKFLKEYMVVGLDWPGFGKSQALDGEYTLKRLAAFLNEFMEKIQIKGCGVIATSMGGYIALTAQQKYEDLFNRMVIFGLTKDLSHFWVFRFAEFSIRLLGRRLSIIILNLVKNSSFLINFIQSAFFPESYGKVKQTQTYVRSALKIPTEVSYAIMKEFLKKDFAAGIGRGVNIPVTFIGAELDPMFPIDRIKKFALEIKNSRVIVVEGDDHSAFAHIDERIGLYKKLLNEFTTET